MTYPFGGLKHNAIHPHDFERLSRSDDLPLRGIETFNLTNFKNQFVLWASNALPLRGIETCPSNIRILLANAGI